MAINGSNPNRKKGPERSCYLCGTHYLAPNSRKAMQPKDRRQHEAADHQADYWETHHDDWRGNE